MRFAKVLVGAGVCLGLLGSVTSAVAQPAPAAGGPAEVPSNIKIVPPIVLRPLIKVHHAVLHWQETPQWCWAASGQMVMEEAGTRTVPQCYEANQALGRTDCCSCPTPAACVQPGWPQWSTWGFNNKTANPLSWAATVQAPLRIAVIGLDRLKAANPDAPVQPLVTPTNAVRSFVVTDGRVTSSVITREINGTWQAVRYGRPLLSAGLAQGLRARSAFVEQPPASVFELDIPALNLWFIAQQEGTRLMLTPAADDERFGFRQGVALDGQAVMSKIVPYAKELRTGDHLVD